MDRKDIKHIGLRVSAEMHRKLAYIAEYDARNVNSLAMSLLNQCIREFEKEHGPIRLDELGE